MLANLAHVGANLAHLRQELDAGHPFVGAETGLAGEVVQVRDEPLKDIFHARVLAERVDADGVFGDVVDREVFHRGEVDLGGIHAGWSGGSVTGGE